MPILRVIAGPHSGQTFTLSEGSVEIGRDAGCGIPLVGDGGISRQHGRVDLQQGRVIVHDLGSSNGVFVNGSRTASTIVQPGDQIQLGNSVLVLEPDAPPAVAPAPVAPASFAPAPVFSAAPVYPNPAGYVSGSPAPPPGYPANAAPAAPATAAYPPPGYPPQGSYTPGMMPPAAGYPPGAMPGYPPGYPAYSVPPPTDRTPTYANWLYFLGFSLPPIGIVLGIIFMLKDTPQERTLGKWLMAWSIVGALLTWISYVEIMRIWHQVAPQLNGGGGMGGLLGGDSSGDPTAAVRQNVPSSIPNSLPGIPARS